MMQNNRILVVDDNDAIHIDFKKVLGETANQALLDQAAGALFEDVLPGAEKRAYEIDSAHQGHEGLRMVEKSIAEGRPYALAFVDVRMPPGWDGIETIQRLWEVDEELQVVLCTAFSDYSWSDMIRKIGESDRLLVIKKPFDSIEVRQVTCALTTKWTLARQAKRTLADLTVLVDERTAALADVNRRLIVEVLERQHASEVLRDTEARMRAIIETAVEAIITVDERGVIELFNPAAEGIFGYAADEVLGKSISLFMSQDASATYRGFLSDYCDSEKEKGLGMRTETRAKRKDGVLFDAELSVTEACVGGIRRFTGIVRDLTRQKQLESQLLQSRKLESVGQLAAGIAHEINTPTQYVGENTRFLQTSFQQMETVLDAYGLLLGAVQCGDLALSLLAAVETAVRDADLDYLRSEIPQAIEQGLEGVERISTIVRAMKAFSHPGSDTKTLVDLNEALRTTATMARSEWRYVADMIFQLDEELPLVPCLPGEMNQVWLNLVVNAAHAISEAREQSPEVMGKITIRSRVVGDHVEVTVSDTGTGIPQSIRDRIFDPYFTTKAVGKGTGQGLAIVRNVVVNKHGGTIALISEVGLGTTFIIQLPLQVKVIGAAQVLASNQTDFNLCAPNLIN